MKNVTTDETEKKRRYGDSWRYGDRQAASAESSVENFSFKKESGSFCRQQQLSSSSFSKEKFSTDRLRRLAA